MEHVRMCLNWKVLAGLGVVALGVLVFAPHLIGAALPLLLVAACPLSMGAMMWGMSRMGGKQDDQPVLTGQSRIGGSLSRQEQLADLRGQLTDVNTRQQGLQAHIREIEKAEPAQLPEVHVAAGEEQATPVLSSQG